MGQVDEEEEFEENGVVVEGMPRGSVSREDDHGRECQEAQGRAGQEASSSPHMKNS